jgi:gas vesicle protein
MSHEHGARNVAIGFLAGAFLGAIGALLISPMSGKRLRRELSREGRRLSNRISETAAEMRDKSSDVYESATEMVSDAARGFKEAARR